MRRTLGVGGATAVAIGATLALAGVASAHNHTVSATCDTDTHSSHYGQSVLTVSLTDYVDTPNYLTITETANGKATVLYPKANFGTTYQKSFYEDGTIAQSYEVVVKAHSNQYSFDQTVTTKACQQPSSPPPPPPTTTTAPPTTTTTAPPTTGTTAPPTTTGSTSAPTTSKPALVAAAPTTPGSGGGLAYTGVSAELPLILGGALVVIGAGSLFAMRILKRRRAEH